jgi:hypothetical protein
VQEVIQDSNYVFRCRQSLVRGVCNEKLGPLVRLLKRHIAVRSSVRCNMSMCSRDLLSTRSDLY